MSEPEAKGELAAAPPTSQTLRRLFLTLFLRGRSARGLRKQKAPKSIAEKLGLTLALYMLMGAFSLAMLRQSIFSLAVYLHGTTFFLLGLFVAASAGEVLFNKDEADILLYRPISIRALLWAKVSVLVQVSVWLGLAFNVIGFFVGLTASDGRWLFPFVHAFSTLLEALFCAGCVVLVYQLCLKWLGRERLEGLMTTAQVLMTMMLVVGSQILPHMVKYLGTELHVATKAKWVALLPPAWFAGFDDALAGSGRLSSWIFAGLGLTATSVVMWLSFGKLARDYERGLQVLSEKGPLPRSAQRRLLERFVSAPPLKWWLRDSVTRASFLLTAAYLVRDRDVKLRLYPGIAPILVFPMIFLVKQIGGQSDFGVAFAGSYLGLLPLLALNLLQYSQQWQASDIFRMAPILGPARICAGARRAVLIVLVLPALALFAVLAGVIGHNSARLGLLLPGVLGLPIFALLPNYGGKATLLSFPTEEAKGASRGLSMLVAVLVSSVISGLASFAWASHWFTLFLMGEAVLLAAVYFILRRSLASAPWPALE